MTVVGIECNGTAFLTSFQRHFKKVHTRNCSFKDFFQNSASKIANCIIVDIVNYLTGFCRILATQSRSISIYKWKLAHHALTSVYGSNVVSGDTITTCSNHF